MSAPYLTTEAGDRLLTESGDYLVAEYIAITGPVTEGPDIALGGIAVCNPIGGLIAENPDAAVGDVTVNQGVSGNITENGDQATGTVSVIQYVTGDVAEGEDLVNGQVGIINYLSGAIVETEDDATGLIEMGPTEVIGNVTEGEDQVSNDSSITIGVSGAIVEHRDIVRGNLFGVSGYKRPGGGWAPQFHYKRDWEIEAEIVAEPELVIDLAAEPDPYFIPQALPIDPAVERIISSILQGPAMVDTDESDIEDILMHL